MAEYNPYERWLAERRDADPPVGFADRVMSGIEHETPWATANRRGIVDATWFHVAACAAASVIFVLRLGCAYSLFIVF